MLSNHSTLTGRYWLLTCLEKGKTQCRIESDLGFALPKMSAPSSGAGCYGDHWHGRARSSSDKAGSHGTAGTDTGNPSCSRSGNMNIPPDGRLDVGKQQQRRDFQSELWRVYIQGNRQNALHAGSFKAVVPSLCYLTYRYTQWWKVTT